MLKRNKVHSFTPKNTCFRIEDEIYNDDIIEDNKEDSLILPKIPIKKNPKKQYKVEVQLQQ